MIITFKSWNETGPNGHRKRCFAAIDSSSSLAEPDRPSGSGQMSADVYDVWCVDLRILSPCRRIEYTLCTCLLWLSAFTNIIWKILWLIILRYNCFHNFSMFLDSGPFCVCIHAYELCSHYMQSPIHITRHHLRNSGVFIFIFVIFLAMPVRVPSGLSLTLSLCWWPCGWQCHGSPGKAGVRSERRTM